MARIRHTVFAASVLTALSLPVVAEVKVQVEFLQPEKFTDVNERQFKSAPEKNQNLKALKTWLEKRAASQLADGQQLQLSFQDIDLAGAFEPWQGPQFQDVRFLKDIYPPRVQFHFKLSQADGSVISEGDRELRDLGYLLNVGTRSDPLEHDKRLLETWLRKEFPKAE